MTLTHPSVNSTGHISDHAAIADYVNALPLGTGSLELRKFYAYGNSYPLGQGSYGQVAGYTQRLASRFRMALTNNAVAGITVATMAQEAFATSAVWSPRTGATAGVVLIDCVLNEPRYNGSPDAAATREFTQSLRAALALFSCGTKLLSTDVSITYGGAGVWTTNNADANSSGGRRAFTPTQNATASIAFTGTDVTFVHQGQVGQTFTLSYTLDGSLVRTVTYGNKRVLGQVGERFTGLSAGAHTMLITKTDAGGFNWIFDSYLLGSAAAAQPVVGIPGNYLTAAGYAVAPNSASNATIDAYNALLVTGLGEFSNAYFADTRPGWNPATMINTTVDNIHPNDAGHFYLANAIAPTLAAVPYLAGIAEL